MEIHIFCTDQCKCIEFYISFCCNLTVQLAYRTTAEITRIFIFGFCFLNLFINLLKIFIADHCFAAQYQLTLIADLKRYIFKDFCIVCDDLAYFSISTGDCLKKMSVPVSQNNGKSVHFPGHQCLLISHKIL